MTIVLIATMVVLLALSAFYSGTETAFTSASRTWLQERSEKGDRRAAIAVDFLRHNDRFLGTVLIGNNLVNISLTTIGRLLITTTIVALPVMEKLLPGVNSPGSSWSEWITSLILTPIVLIFGEVLPKALARSRANNLTLLTARPMHWCERMLSPMVKLMSFLSRRLTGDSASQQPRITREDLKALTELVAEEGLVGKESGEMLQMILELDQQPVETVMVPLIEIQSLPEEATIAQAIALTERTGFTSIPVYSGRVDCIVGLVSLKDLLHQADEATLDDPEFLQQPIAPYAIRNLLYVPESQSVSTLLEELRKLSLPVAVVVDEYGGMTGMVTTDDLVESIVGTLEDERNMEVSRIHRIAPGNFICSGRMEIRQLEELLGFHIPNIGFETAAGLVLKLAGQIPAEGRKFTYRNYQITVLTVEQHRITQLQFQRQAS